MSVHLTTLYIYTTMSKPEGPNNIIISNPGSNKHIFVIEDRYKKECIIRLWHELISHFRLYI